MMCCGSTEKIFPLLFVFASGLLCDLLWSDPDKDVRGWGENDRGVSFTFGPDIVTRFNNRHDIDLICRAHQVRGTRKAIEPQAGRQVVTVSFSLVS